MPDGRIRVVFGSVTGYGQESVTGGEGREARALESQNARMALYESGLNDDSGQGYAVEYGADFTRAELVDSDVQVNYGHALENASARAAETVANAKARMA